jgi:hypothetical protein
VLTKDILFGMNILSLAGFLVMGLSLTLTPHWECRGTFEHWTDVRWNSSGILPVVCGQFVKIAKTDPPRSSTFRTTRPEKMGACDGKLNGDGQ